MRTHTTSSTFLSIALAFVIATSPAFSKDDDEKPIESVQCRTTLSKVGRSALKIVPFLLLFGIPLVPEATATLTGMPHIGHSIYLDMPNVEGLLTPAEKKLLLDPQKNRNAIIEMFIEKIKPNYKLPSVSEGTFVMFRPRMASSYFDPENPDKGVCRNKALVLSAVLNHYGIKAIPEAGVVNSKTENSSGHMWLYLPETDEVVDPTWGLRIKSEDYYSKRAAVSYRVRGYQGLLNRWLGAYVR